MGKQRLTEQHRPSASLADLPKISFDAPLNRLTRASDYAGDDVLALLLPKMR